MLLSKQSRFSWLCLINKSSCLEVLWFCVVLWEPTYIHPFPKGTDPYFSGDSATFALGLLGHPAIWISWPLGWLLAQDSPISISISKEEEVNKDREHKLLIHFLSLFEHRGIGLFLSDMDQNVKWVFKWLNQQSNNDLHTKQGCISFLILLQSFLSRCTIIRETHFEWTDIKTHQWDSLVVQWLRLHLPMQGVWVWSLDGELRSHVPCGFFFSQ